MPHEEQTEVAMGKGGLSTFNGWTQNTGGAGCFAGRYNTVVNRSISRLRQAGTGTAFVPGATGAQDRLEGYEGRRNRLGYLELRVRFALFNAFVLL